MFCEKCGAKLKEGQKFCDNCGNKIGDKKTSKKEVVEKQENVNETVQTTQNVNTQIPNVNVGVTQNPPKKDNKVVVIILIVGAVIVAFIALLIAVVVFAFKSSEKLVCESSKGNITLLYDKDSLNGYTVTGSITYDLEGQQDIAERIGIDSYLSQFNTWFENNTDGTCVRKK